MSFTFDKGFSISTFSNKSPKDTSSVGTKFHLEPPGLAGTEICSSRSGHMANMSATPIYGKNL